MSHATETDETMTVRVIDRSRWGTSSPYPLIQEVAISVTCPRCGARRGESWPHRFHEDGQWLTCDRWDNPCGHVDMYESVLAEARARHERMEHADG